MLALFGGPLRAQDTDSLWSAWKSAANHDTLRLDALNRIIRSVGTDADSAYTLALRMERFARAAGRADWRIRAMRHQVDNLWERGDLLGASAGHDSMLAVQRARGDSAGVATTLRSQAGHFTRAGDFARATELYHQALRIRDQLGDTLGAARIMTSLGILCMDHGDTERALAYYERSLAMHIAAGDSVNTGVILNTICTPLRALGRCEEALANNRRAMRIHERAKRPIGIAASLNHMAAAYNRMGQPKLALEHARRSIRIRSDIADTVGVAYARLQEAKALIQLGEHAAAALSASEALRIGTKRVDMPIRTEAAELLHQAYKALGNYRKALEMQELQLQLDDSLAGDKTKRALISRDLQYTYDKQALADSLEMVRRAEEERCAMDGQLEVERERRSFLITSGILGALVFVLIAFLLVKRLQQARRLARQEKALHEKQVDELLQKNEITAMHAMFEGQEKERDRVARDLHDRVGSMLGNVKMQMEVLEERMDTDQRVREDQYKKVYGLLVETVGEVRRISHDMVAGTLARFGLEKALEGLCDSVRVSGRLAVELRVFGLENRLERSMEITVYRIVQELVGNALKHAKATELSIDLTRTPGRLSVIVSDNGIGFDASRPPEGMGLTNVRQRAATIGGEITIDSTPGKGTTVSMECAVVE